MKRYWRLIAIVTVIVLSIGTFYVKSALSASNFPEFIFEKVSGSEAELDPVILSGSYQAVTNGANERFKLTTDEATFNGELSFFERLSKLNSPGLNQLQDEYRGFMRGKSGNLTSFYDGEGSLAYANVINQFVYERPSEMEFDVEILDKKNGETTAFTVPVPNRAMYSHLYIEDVQMSDGQLKVITQNYLKDSNRGLGNQETHMYSFDVSKQEINGAETIVSAEKSDKNRLTHVNMLPDTELLSKHNYIIFKATEEALSPKSDKEDKMAVADESVVNLVAYNLKTEEKRTVKLPKEHDNKNILAYDGSLLYLMGGMKDQRALVLYDFETEQVINKITIPSLNTENSKESGAQSMVKISDGKAYMANTQFGELPAGIMVIDIRSGEMLYNGKIKTKKPVGKEAFILFNGIDIK